MTQSLKDRWEATYQQAEYRLMLESGSHVLHIGAYDAQAEAALILEAGLRHEWFIITPCNPRSQRARADMNMYYLDQLRYEIGGDAGNVYHTLNHDPTGQWPDEPGFLLLDTDRVWVMDLGKRFHQNALVTAKVGEAPRLLWLEK